MANVLRFSRSLCNIRGAVAAAPRHKRLISTTPKKHETLAVDTAPKVRFRLSTMSSDGWYCYFESFWFFFQTAEDFRNVAAQKNWVSWGFERFDKKKDENVMHATTFITVTLCMVVVGFVWGYAPDMLLRDWAQREGYLELRRREAAGLEPISANYVDPAAIELPSDEELGGMEIII